MYSYSFDNYFYRIVVPLYKNSDNYSAMFVDKSDNTHFETLTSKWHVFSLVFSLETRCVQLVSASENRNIATRIPKYGSNKCQIIF